MWYANKMSTNKSEQAAASQSIGGILISVGLFGMLFGGSHILGAWETGALFDGTSLADDSTFGQVLDNFRRFGWLWFLGGLASLVLGTIVGAGILDKGGSLDKPLSDVSRRRYIANMVMLGFLVIVGGLGLVLWILELLGHT